MWTGGVKNYMERKMLLEGLVDNSLSGDVQGMGDVYHIPKYAVDSAVTKTAGTALTAAANTSITYVYIKNTNTDASHILTLKDDAGNAFADLEGGEFAFLPVKGAVGLECQASGADVVAEYGYWTKG